jgi:hypothetical protein
VSTGNLSGLSSIPVGRAVNPQPRRWAESGPDSRTFQHEVPGYVLSFLQRVDESMPLES